MHRELYAAAQHCLYARHESLGTTAEAFFGDMLSTFSTLVVPHPLRPRPIARAAGTLARRIRARTQESENHGSPLRTCWLHTAHHSHTPNMPTVDTVAPSTENSVI